MLDIDFIKDAAYQNIEDILDNLDLEYRHENGWLTLQCMFHNGTDFNLKFRGDGFYCFSQCRRQYSIYDIVQKVNNFGFYDALSWLADFLGIEDDKTEVIRIDTETKSYINALRKMSKIKHKDRVVYEKVDQYILNTIDPFYHPWLEQCGLSQETCSHFNIGYSRSGVLDGRVCFPIKSPAGDTISISGRMPNYKEVNASRYYIIGHSHVSKTLYNLSEVLKVVAGFDRIYIVEGFKSVMRLYQEGYYNVVASMGASLSDDQRNLLLKTGLNISVICDADQVGEQFGQSVYNKCYQMADVKIIKLSEITTIKKASVDDLTNEQFRRLEKDYLWQ